MTQISVFNVKKGSMNICGKKYYPSKDNNRIPIIISHGFLGNEKSVAGYAKQFADWGYTAYTFDFCGGGPKTKSDGTMVDMSVLTEVEDLEAVAQYVKNDIDVDGDKLILMGCSQGGFVSSLVAAKLQENIAKLILLYPAFCIPEDAKAGKMQFFEFDPNDIPDTVKGIMGLKIGRRYIEDALRVDIYNEICSYKGPVLILHGTNDRIVNIEYSRRAFKAYRDSRKEDVIDSKAYMFEIQNADHGFKKKEDELAFNLMEEFLNGGREILNIDVKLTGHDFKRDGFESIITLPFSGFVNGDFFEGSIMEGGKDVQRRRGLKPVLYRASYDIKGHAYNGQEMTIHIENQTTDGINWKPTLIPDSDAVPIFNDAECRTVFEGRKEGPVIHIFTNI